MLIDVAQGETRNEERGKIINVVYDDSGSMVQSNGKNIKRWSQAKYALEVFSAMMGEDDEMNIYPMSAVGELEMTIYGDDENRVSFIHEMNTTYGNTPFATVISAAQSLEKRNENKEKWLIIITDGAFDDGATPTATVQKRLDQCNEKGIKTAYLGIGNEAVSLRSQPAKGSYSEKAEDGKQVLEKVMRIANQIFVHQVVPEKLLSVSEGGATFSADIPIEQIIVFAQGKNVSIGDLEYDGKEVKAASTEFVKYSDVKPLNYKDAAVDKKLQGVVATFEPSERLFAEGEFSIPIDNADTLEIYYTPGVAVKCDLLYNGRTIKEKDELYAGNYSVKMGFVNPITKKEIQSELLSQAEFKLIVRNEKTEKTLESEQGFVTLEAGNVEIEATAELPGHVQMVSKRNYEVLPEAKEIFFTVQTEDLNFDLNALNDSEGIKVIAQYIDKENGETYKLDKEAWENITPKIESDGKIEWSVEKGEELSTWIVVPHYYKGDPVRTSAGQVKNIISCEGKVGNQTYLGESSFIASFSKLSFMNYVKILGPKIGALFFALWLAVGYIKKKRIKTRKLNPRCSYDGIISGRRPIKKNLLSVVLPYVSEKAIVKSNDIGLRCYFPKLQIKAVGSQSFKIMNKRMELSKIKVNGQRFNTIEELNKQRFGYSNFKIESIDAKGNTLGQFTFK